MDHSVFVCEEGLQIWCWRCTRGKFSMLLLANSSFSAGFLVVLVGLGSREEGISMSKSRIKIK
jgi:hypothetical protein